MSAEIRTADECLKKHRKEIFRIVMLGWMCVLLCSMAIYDALLFSSLQKSLWADVQASAHVAAETLRLNIDSGLRFGKRLATYRGLSELTDSVSQTSERPMAVLAKGKILARSGHFPENNSGVTLINEADDVSVSETKEGRILSVPVGKTAGKAAGRIAVWIERAPLQEELHAAFMRQVLLQALASVAGVFLLAFFLRLWMRRNGDRLTSLTLPAAVRRLSVAVFLLVMTASGISAIWTVSDRYTEDLARDGARTGALLVKNINRLLMVGLTFDNMDNIDGYLRSVAGLHGNRIAFEIRTTEDKRLAASCDERTELLSESKRLLLVNTGSTQATGSAPAETVSLSVSIVREPWKDRIQAAVIDIVTMLAVSLIFMIELFLLMTRFLQWKAVAKREKPLAGAALENDASLSAARAALLRPIIFFMMFAIDMSISFIPLRMGELAAAGDPSRDMLMALPVSMEMGLAGLSVLVAGKWISRRGARPTMLAGLSLIALGYLASMAATSPWQFIAARGIVGAGYGLSVLTAQAVSVKDGLLADMFSGLYAGSLCGSAVGAMLAEHFGFGIVFILSAVVLGALVPVAGRLIEKGVDPRSTSAKATHLSFMQLVRLLTDRRFVAFSLLALLPFAIFSVGFLNYFCPIFLDGAGVSQSDIGRIFMINCLVVIYTGPLFTPLVNRCSKTLATALAGVLCGLSVVVLALFPPLPAALAGSILLGVATGLSIPAHSEFLLELDVARAIGVDQAMSLLDALQRIGQVLGPILTGLALLVMTVDEAAWVVGLIFVGLSLVFWVLGGAARRASKEAQS